MKIISTSADGKQVSVSEIKSEMNSVPFHMERDRFMRKYDPILKEWFIVEIPEPISRATGQQAKREDIK